VCTVVSPTSDLFDETSPKYPNTNEQNDSLELKNRDLQTSNENTTVSLVNLITSDKKEINIIDSPLPKGLMLPTPLNENKKEELLINLTSENIDPEMSLINLTSENIVSELSTNNKENIISSDKIHLSKNIRTTNKRKLSINTIDNDENCNCFIKQIHDAKKPRGGASIDIQMSLRNLKKRVNATICVDTGADFTLCDSAFLIQHFGDDALKHLYYPDKIPSMKSASGHQLELLGKIKLDLHLGEYELKVNVIVYKSETNMFLLGSDSFYNKLIYDRGMFLAFAENKYPPIPIRYELPKQTVKAVQQYQVAPQTKALIYLKVTDNVQLTGK